MVAVRPFRSAITSRRSVDATDVAKFDTLRTTPTKSVILENVSSNLCSQKCVDNVTKF